MSVNQVVLHDINTALILRTIQDYSPISRVDIAERIGLAASTVSVITKELQRRNLIRECGRATSTVGRRKVLLEINPNGGHFICVDLSGSKITVGVLSLLFQKVQSWNFARKRRTGDSLYEYLVEVIEQARIWCEEQNLPVLGIGVATPGLVDPNTGRVVEADNLHWHDFDLQMMLQRAFAYPVVVENDTNAAAFGEYKYGYENGNSAANLMWVTIETGIGAGLILGGNLYAGSSGMAGEIGHVVVDMDGPQCICGNRGCVEAVASSSAMLRAYQQLVHAGEDSDADIDMDWLIEQAEKGNEQALQVLADAGQAIGRAVGSQVNVLNLDSVLFGGIPERSQKMFDAIVDGIHLSTLPKMRGRLEIGLASLGATASLVGVASLSLERMVKVAAG